MIFESASSTKDKQQGISLHLLQSPPDSCMELALLFFSLKPLGSFPWLACTLDGRGLYMCFTVCVCVHVPVCSLLLGIRNFKDPYLIPHVVKGITK